MPSIIRWPDGRQEAAKWIAASYLQDWNTIEVPSYGHEPGKKFNLEGNSAFLRREAVRIEGDTVHYQLGTAEVAGIQLDQQEVMRLFAAGYKISMGARIHYTAPLSACKFWHLSFSIYGRDN